MDQIYNGAIWRGNVEALGYYSVAPLVGRSLYFPSLSLLKLFNLESSALDERVRSVNSWTFSLAIPSRIFPFDVLIAFSFSFTSNLAILILLFFLKTVSTERFIRWADYDWLAFHFKWDQCLKKKKKKLGDKKNEDLLEVTWGVRTKNSWGHLKTFSTDNSEYFLWIVSSCHFPLLSWNEFEILVVKLWV